MDAAREGDAPSAKLILERCLPALRPENRPLPAGIFADPKAITEAAAAGRLSIEQAAGLLDLAGKAAAVEGLVEMEARLGALEALLAKPND